MFVVRSKKSLSTVFLFFLSRLPFFFCSFSRKRLLVFAAFEFFSQKQQQHMCDTFTCDRRKKKKRRVSVVVSVSVVVLSSDINAFLFSVVALFRSIDDDEEF